MSFWPYIIGAVVVLVGIRTIWTREATLSIPIWQRERRDFQDTRSIYATSEHSGLLAILIGIAQVLAGLGIMFKWSD